jgi:hypothetical protein
VARRICDPENESTLSVSFSIPKVAGVWDLLCVPSRNLRYSTVGVGVSYVDGLTNYSFIHTHKASPLGIVLYVSCRERVVDIPLRSLGIVSVAVRWCYLKIVFQAKWQIRLLVKTSQRPCTSIKIETIY